MTVHPASGALGRDLALITEDLQFFVGQYHAEAHRGDFSDYGLGRWKAKLTVEARGAREILDANPEASKEVHDALLEAVREVESLLDSVILAIAARTEYGSAPRGGTELM